MQITYKPDETLRISERIYKTGINGLLYLAHKAFPDERGFYSEVAIITELESVIKTPFTVKQINHSHSITNVVRGFHAEAWDKLITVFSGICFCALVDLRPNSPTFAKVETFILGSADNTLGGSLFISRGIANSVCIVKGPVDYMYEVNSLYKDRDPKGDIAISLFDPDLHVSWPIPKDQMIMSDRDKRSIILRELFPEKFKS